MDIFDNSNLMVIFGKTLYECIDTVEFEFKILPDLRKKIREEKGILFPDILIDSTNQIPDFEADIVFMGNAIEEITCDLDDQYCFINLLSDISDVIYKNIDVFKDFDYETEIKKLEKERTHESYEKIITFYRYINPSDKMAFHYIKKIAEFGRSRDLKRLAKCLNAGLGCKPNPALAKKITLILKRKDNNRIKDKTF